MPTPRDSLWRKLALAFEAGLQTYNEAALSPVNAVADLYVNDWDSFDSRLFRYHHYNFYYSNRIYSELVRYAATHRAKGGLYKWERSIFNPVYRLVELLASKTYPGQLDLETMHTGAMPFNRLDDAHRKAINNLWKWSNITGIKQRFPRDCARFGDSIMKVVDDPFAKKVRLEVYHPGIIAEADITPRGTFDRVVIAYMRQDNALEKPWLYEEEITKERFATFRDGEPWGEYLDAEGNRISSWDNEYGFVPIVLARALELEHSWGAPTFFGTLPKIDQANDQASILYDQIRKEVNPVFWAENVSSMSQILPQVVGEEGSARDRIMILLGPAGSKATPMLADINIGDALKGIEMILEEIENDHPELSLHRLRKGERVTGPGVLTAYDDAIQRVQDYRSAVDGPVLRAHQMALTIGGIRGYEGFDAFNLNSYEAGDLDFEIAARPVLADNLTKKERLDLLLQSKAPKRHVWRDLDLTEEEIQEAEQEAEERAEAFAENTNPAGQDNAPPAAQESPTENVPQSSSET